MNIAAFGPPVFFRFLSECFDVWIVEPDEHADTPRRSGSLALTTSGHPAAPPTSSDELPPPHVATPSSGDGIIPAQTSTSIGAETGIKSIAAVPSQSLMLYSPSRGEVVASIPTATVVLCQIRGKWGFPAILRSACQIEWIVSPIISGRERSYRVMSFAQSPWSVAMSEIRMPPAPPFASTSLRAISWPSASGLPCWAAC